MTREEAKKIILKHQFAFASMPDDVIEAINYLVKEEPFINKPCCISGEVCEHDKNAVLDKIKAELTEKRDILVKEARANAINPLSCYGLDYALLIIDKYKGDN